MTSSPRPPPISPSGEASRAASTDAAVIHDDRIDEPSPSTAFDAVRPRLCGECLTLLRPQRSFPWHLGDRHGDVLAFVDSHLPDDADHDLLDREFYESVKLRDRFTGDHAGRQVACEHCGATSTGWRTMPRDLTETRDHAINLSVALDELEVTHDWVTLVEQALAYKRQPDLAGDDHAVFAKATADAIEAVP